ncbi:hypothetical protein HMPREF3120_09755 [Corynebacterium sp. HMSC11D10]|nr:hypothetical protein HMPREF3120_09755 [Corynebacterium sp. HMSC11D10]
MNRMDNMAKQKTIQLFLIDGTANGPVKASIGGWLGRVYSLPVRDLRRPDINSREELQNHAIYFLVGTEEGTDAPIIYVGQAAPRKNSGPLARAHEHLRKDHRNSRDELDEAGELQALEDRAWFNRAIYLVTSDNSWGQTELNYLENAFYRLAKDVGSYELGNKSEPPAGNVAEENLPVLKDFVENTRLILNALGINAFEAPLGDQNNSESKPTRTASPASVDDPVFEIGTPGSFYGEARRTADKFVVLKGALLSNSIVPSAPASVARYREMFANFIENRHLTKDIPFPSPTAAATFLSGNSISGPVLSARSW